LGESTGESSARAEPPGAASATSARRRWVELGVFVGLLAGTLAAAAYVATLQQSARVPARPFEVVRVPAPEPAPAFELRDLAGRRLGPDDLRGRVVLLTFWATWCEPCRVEMPAMMALERELGPKGLAVVAVNVKEPASRVEAFVKELGFTSAVLLDPRGEVSERYQVQALPTTYLLARDGRLVALALGYRDWQSPGARSYVAGLLGPAPAVGQLGSQ
jgi:thiol-disulfide isomerase/thioredoxin